MDDMSRRSGPKTTSLTLTLSEQLRPNSSPAEGLSKGEGYQFSSEGKIFSWRRLCNFYGSFSYICIYMPPPRLRYAEEGHILAYRHSLAYCVGLVFVYIDACSFSSIQKNYN